MLRTKAILCCFLTAAVVLVGCDQASRTDRVKVEDLEAMQVDVPDDYISKLKAIIEGDSDPYVRERAVFTLAEIAVRRHETGDVVGIVREVAENESDDNVRTAAYANLDVIRSYAPPENNSTLELNVTGDLRKGETITLTAKVSSRIDIEKEAMLSIPSLHNNVELVSGSRVQKIRLQAGEPREVEYKLKLNETGTYFVPVSLLVSLSRTEHEKLREEVHLVVE